MLSLTRFLERSGLEHQLAQSTDQRLVYVLVEDLHSSQLRQLVEEALADTYRLTFEVPADNRLICELADPTPEQTDAGLDGGDPDDGAAGD